MAYRFEFSADVATMAGMLADAGFLQARSEALGEESCEVDVTGDDEAYTLKMTRAVVRDLPKVLSKMFDSRQVMAMTENWRWNGEGYDGDLTVTIQGQPVTISGDFSLMPDGDGSVYQITHKVKAKIPLVGKQVEKFILGQLGDGVKDEMDYAASQL